MVTDWELCFVLFVHKHMRIQVLSLRLQTRKGTHQAICVQFARLPNPYLHQVYSP